MTRSRARRAKGEAGTPLDDRTLCEIRALQPVETTTWAELRGGNRDVSRRSWNRMEDAGYLKIHRIATEKPRLLTLTRAGARRVAAVLGIDADEVYVPRSVPDVGLDHHLGTVSFVTALIVASRRSGAVELGEVALDRDLRARAGNHARNALVPDAVVKLTRRGGPACGAVGSRAAPGPVSSLTQASLPAASTTLGNVLRPALHNVGTVAAVVEYDLGTENPSWFATRKAVPYAGARAAGRPVLGCADFVVLVVAPNVRRVNRMALACVAAGVPGGVLFFASAGDLDAGCVLTDRPWRTWRPDGGENTVALVAENPFAALVGVRSPRPVGTDAVGENSVLCSADFRIDRAGDPGRKERG